MHISIWMEWKDLDLATVEEGQAVVEDTSLIKVMERVGTQFILAGNQPNSNMNWL